MRRNPDLAAWLAVGFVGIDLDIGELAQFSQCSLDR